MKDGKKPTLLFINSRFLPFVGGGQTYIFELMRYFHQQGWDVHLATRDCGVRIETWEGCSIHYVDGFDDEGQEVRKSLRDIRAVLDRVRPDLVHVHNIWPFFTYSNVVKPGEFPTVWHIHNVPVLGERLFGNGSLGNYDAETAFLAQLHAGGKHDKLLVGSQYYLDTFGQAIPEILTDGKSEIAYYFLPEVTKGPLIERVEDDLWDSEEPINMIYPSRLMDRKGIEDLLAAMVYLPTRFRLLVPAFVNGNFPEYRARIRSMVQDFHLTERVELAGMPTSLEGMRLYYERAHMAVMPSHFEGFGITALESMSWGLALVAARVGGLKEIVRHEENGLMIEPRDSLGITRSILRIAKETRLRHALIRGGIKTVRHRFTLRGEMNHVASIYASVLEGRL